MGRAVFAVSSGPGMVVYGTFSSILTLTESTNYFCEVPVMFFLNIRALLGAGRAVLRYS